jgi:DNA-binding transcriptional regulator YiaG
MPNIAKVLKDEIQRIAKKEIKTSASELHKSNVSLKKTLADLRRQIASMKQEVRQLKKFQGKQAKAEPQVTSEAAEKLRFSAKGIRSLRSKLKLSQADFAKLVGVSSLAVYQWERKEGKLALRQATKSKLAEIRSLGRKEALGRLGKDEIVEAGKEKSVKPIRHGAKRSAEKPLAEYVQKVLAKKKAGMTVKDIAEAVQKLGYKTTSKKFANVVTVFLAGKDKRFERCGRGVYKLA